MIMKTKVYDHKGKEARTIDLPENIFGLNWNSDLVHQVVIGMQSNARANTAHTKDRSEVRGGGRKPWRQKGTGQARHGSKRSPIWSGGGITFGPRTDRNYDKKINTKMRRKALLVALSQKLRDGQILFIDSFDENTGKTKDMIDSFKAFAGVEGFETLNTKKHNNAFMVSQNITEELKKGTKNMFHVSLQALENINVVDILNHRYIIMTNPEQAVEFLATKLTGNKA
jgi:large subunit ribosomal protein L4